MVVLPSYPAISDKPKLRSAHTVSSYRNINRYLIKRTYKTIGKPVNDASGLFSTITASKRLLLSKRQISATIWTSTAVTGVASAIGGNTMKNQKAIKRNNKRIHVRKFLSTPEGRKWLEEKQKERQEMQLVRELSQFI